MNKRFTKLGTLCTVIAGGIAFLTLSSYSTGNPGNTTAGCASGGSTCHGGSASAATILTITGIPASGWVPGTTYSLVASVNNNTKVRAGFDLGCSVGTFNNAGSTSTTALTNGNKEIYHTTPNAMTGGVASWSFTWTAPATGTSAVFNFAGNAVNFNGASSGDVWNTSTQTFNAAPAAVTAPTVTLNPVTGISNTAATLHASVNANGATTGLFVKYGLTTSYGSNLQATPASVSGTTATAVSAALSGLQPNKTYHYQIEATNSAGVTTTPDATFTTTNLSVAGIAAAGFKMYPNPVQDVLTIDAATAKSPLSILVLDAAGKAVQAPVSRSGNVYTLQLAGLNTGLYWLRLNDGVQTYSSSFMKQ